MNLYDKSSLILIPGAVKDGKIYSQRPENGDGDFIFSRGTSATRVDENGLIEKGRENLLLQSNQFDTTWANASTSETGGQTGYDGSSDAWLLSKSGNGGRIYQNVAVSNLNTFSVYAKANTLNWVSLWTNIGTSYFDLENGVVGDITASTSITSNIESVGNGWYRCSFVFNTTISQVRIYPADGNLDTSGSSGSIYIQDAQLEVGLVATDYLETTTTTAVSGITGDLPRLDYSGGASCPSLLLEPQRTNYVLHSEKLNSNSISGGTYIPNAEISPDGTRNAYGIDQDSAGDRIQPNIGTYDGLVTLSMYIKPVATIRPRLNVFNSVNGSVYGALFQWDGTDFTITSDGEGYTDAGYENAGNGWYRLWVVGTSISGGNILGQFRPNTNGDISNRLYFWGLQAERGSYPSSYIPTYGASVTRVADGTLNLVGSFSNAFGSPSLTKYSILIDIKKAERASLATSTFLAKGDNAQGRINLAAGTSIAYYSLTTAYMSYNLIADGNPHKYLLVANDGVIKQFFDGALIDTDNNPSDEFVSFTLVGSSGDYSDYGLSSLITFNSALTDEEAIALTTL